MACSNNQSGVFPGRPQMPTPPCMNTNCSGVCNDNSTAPPKQPRMRQRNSESFYRASVPVESVLTNLPQMNNIDSYGSMPVAMAYVPWQQWYQTYPIEQAISRGTLFPELDFPFVMGRCR